MLAAIFALKCPRCRKGHLFVNKSSYQLKGGLKLKPECPACGQPTQLETGFYYGTGYVSYGISVAFSVFFAAAWALTLGFSLHDNRVFWWVATNSVLLLALQPYIMRLSRVLWLTIFVGYEKEISDR